MMRETAPNGVRWALSSRGGPQVLKIKPPLCLTRGHADHAARTLDEILCSMPTSARALGAAVPSDEAALRRVWPAQEKCTARHAKCGNAGKRKSGKAEMTEERTRAGPGAARGGGVRRRADVGGAAGRRHQAWGGGFMSHEAWGGAGREGPRGERRAGAVRLPRAPAPDLAGSCEGHAEAPVACVLRGRPLVHHVRLQRRTNL